MELEIFEIERWQSTCEYVVEHDLEESGVRPLPLREPLGSETAVETFLDSPVGHLPSEGTPELQSTVAGLFEGARDAALGRSSRVEGRATPSGLRRSGSLQIAKGERHGREDPDRVVHGPA